MKYMEKTSYAFVEIKKSWSFLSCFPRITLAFWKINQGIHYLSTCLYMLNQINFQQSVLYIFLVAKCLQGDHHGVSSRVPSNDLQSWVYTKRFFCRGAPYVTSSRESCHLNLNYIFWWLTVDYLFCKKTSSQESWQSVNERTRSILIRAFI